MPDTHLLALSDRAWSLVETHQLAEARSLFKQICELDESDPEAWMMLGYLHAEFSEDGEALSCLRKALDLDPTYPDAHFNLAKILLKQRHIEQAQAHCRTAVEHDPAYAAAWLLLGAIQEALGHFPDSEMSSRRAVELAPGNAASHANLALALWKQNKLNESVRSYQRSLQLSPQQVEVWLQLAAVCTHLHAYADAEQCYHKVIALAPGKLEVFERLADIHAKAGKFEEEIDALRRALHIKPNHAGLHLRLGKALHAQKQWEAAASAFLEAIRLAPDDAEAYFGLGAVCGARGMKQEELANFQKALSLEPANDQYQFHVARVTGMKTPATAPASYVRTLFDACAGTFDTHLVEQLSYKGPELLHGAVMEITGTTCESMDVLDLGCGTGLCAPLFRPLARNLSGIDLSERMIDVARKLDLYDRLIIGDITEVMQGLKEVHDLIIAADVFIYVGELTQIFERCSTALKASGVFAFTVEAPKDETADFVLEPSGRYSHSSQYLAKLARSFGLETLSIRNAVLRMERERPVNGYVVVMRRQDTGHPR